MKNRTECLIVDLVIAIAVGGLAVLFALICRHIPTVVVYAIVGGGTLLVLSFAQGARGRMP